MIALASASPRRRELLTQLGLNFVVVKGDIDESQLSGETPEQYVERLAKGKAQAGYANQSTPLPTLGADTIVEIDGQVLGKPADYADFQRMMQLLSGRQHRVRTAVALCCGDRTESILVTTDVSFRVLSEQDILQYWQSGEPADKAGGYGIQGKAGRFVTQLSGSYFAVVGLPLFETEQLLKQQGVLA